MTQPIRGLLFSLPRFCSTALKSPLIRCPLRKRQEKRTKNKLCSTATVRQLYKAAQHCGCLCPPIRPTRPAADLLPASGNKILSSHNRHDVHLTTPAVSELGVHSACTMWMCQSKR